MTVSGDVSRDQLFPHAEEFISHHEGIKSRYLDLLVGRDGTEDDLREALSWEHPEADPTDDASVFDEGEGLVLSVDVSRG